MGREMKFRAWDKQDKRMIAGEQDFIPLLVTSKGVFRLNPHHQEPLWALCEKERFELMQYTGLLDKNGREIYEGDIVHRKYHESNTVAVRKVVFHNDGFKLQETGKYTGFSLLYPAIEDIEVTGNIYENPELLEV